MRPIVLLLFLLSLVVPLTAQQAPGGRPPAAIPEAEPEEPAIVLPEVILRIEDISVEQVEAGLPQDEELLPPEREIPLPEPGELVIEEPLLASYSLGGDAGLPPGREGSLVAEGVLGAGSMNHFYSSISLFRTGDEPRFQLKFLHELLDGFSAEPPGSGFSRRVDSLTGSLRFHLGALALDIEGAVEDYERGLQGLSTLFATEIERTGMLLAESALPVGDLWTFGAGVDTHAATQLLTSSGGGAPRGRTELAVQPHVYGEIRTDTVWFGLTGLYGYRTVLEDDSFLLHRAGVTAELGFNLPMGFRLEGRGGWYHAGGLGHLFPFDLTLAGSPTEMLSFTLRGGYRVQQLDLLDILRAYDFTALPVGLKDNHGWFGELNTTVSLLRNFFLNGEARLYFDSAMPDPYRTGADPGLDADGLLFFDQTEATRLTTSLGFRWNPGSMFSMGAGWEMEWLDRPALVPPLRLRLESEGLGRDGLWGWNASVLLYDFEGLQMPLFNLNGFYRISETIRMILEIDDIFQPLQNEPRSVTPPYVDAGIRGTVKVQITL